MEQPPRTRAPLSGDLAGGVTACLVALPVCLAYAPVVFAAALPAHLPAAVGAMLLTVATINLAGALLGASPLPVAVTDAPTALMLGGALAALLPRTASLAGAPDLPFALALLALALALAGLIQTALGLLQAGRLAKYIPLPVVAGLRTGTALLILAHQARPLLGIPADLPWPALPALVSAASPVALASGIATLFVALAPAFRRTALPAPLLALLAGTALHHLLVVALPALPAGATVGVAARATLHAPLFALPTARFAALPADLLVDLVLLACGLATLAALQTALTLATLDAVDGTRTSSSREILAGGVGTLLSAALGGVAAAPLSTPALAARAAGAATRRARGVTALCALLLLLVGGPLLAAIPKAALAGVVAALCFGLFDPRLPRTLAGLLRGEREARDEAADLAIALAVAAVLIAFGILAATGFGVLLSILHFARRMERGNVRRIFSADRIHSNVHRNGGEFERLVAEGGAIRVMELEGALFFATADRLGRTIEETAGEGIRHLILDFSRVTEVDATALDLLAREARRLERAGVDLAACGLPGAARAGRRISAGSLGERIGRGRILPDLESALARAEDLLLDALIGPDRRRRATALPEFELFRGLSAEEVGALAARFRRREYPEGALLARAGEPADRMHLLAVGRVEVRLAAPDGTVHRLGALTGGAVLGEMALLDGGSRSADLVATAYCLCFEIAAADLAALETARPDLHRKLLAALARELARRLRIANHIITGLKG